MHVVLTGANGVIGRPLLKRFAEEGHEVVAVFRPGGTPAHVPPNVVPVEIDLTGQLPVQRLPAKIDAVAHFAQCRQYRDFPASAQDVFHINTALAVALADYAYRSGARQFLYASTGSVYRPSRQPLDETAETAPASFYAISKYASELLIRSYANLFRVLIPRFFYVYGPGEKDRLFSNLAANIIAKRPVTLDGVDGIELTPLFSDDCAHILYQAMAGGLSGILNVGHPERVTLRQLAITIGQVVGIEPRFEQKSRDKPPSLIPALGRLAAFADLNAFLRLPDGLRRTFGPAVQGWRR
jgi:nucleoside-diphosphate-sugar epimerase